MRKGFKGFMNKVFKVVWSKSKECYVVVPEIAKNNSGKKKVLASVLAGLALVGVGAQMGTPVDAFNSATPRSADSGSINTENSRINISANAKPNNNVGVNSIVVGYQNTTDDQDGTTALGANNQAYGNSGLAVGNQNESRGGASTAIGAGNRASGAATVAIGNVSNANAKSAIAIGSYNNVNYTKGTWATAPMQAGEYSTVVGNYSSATGRESAAMGVYSNSAGPGSFAAGYKENALGQNSVAIGSENTSHVADTITLGQQNNARTMGGISIGKNNLTDSANGDRSDVERNRENSQIAIGTTHPTIYSKCKQQIKQ